MGSFAAVTKYHSLSGLNGKVLSHSSGGQKSEFCRPGWLLLRAVSKDLSPAPPWLVDGRPLSTVGVCLCVQISSFYKDISWIGLGPTLMISF